MLEFLRKFLKKRKLLHFLTMINITFMEKILHLPKMPQNFCSRNNCQLFWRHLQKWRGRVAYIMWTRVSTFAGIFCFRKRNNNTRRKTKHKNKPSNNKQAGVELGLTQAERVFFLEKWLIKGWTRKISFAPKNLCPQKIGPKNMLLLK